MTEPQKSFAAREPVLVAAFVVWLFTNVGSYLVAHSHNLVSADQWQQFSTWGVPAVSAGILALGAWVLRTKVTPWWKAIQGRYPWLGAVVSITKQQIPETLVPGKRLGRHVNHDSRSLAYRVTPGAQPTAPILWQRNIPILDQGNLGSCTGNAETGALGSGPIYAALIAAGTLTTKKITLDETFAVELYSAATEVDSYAGTYPPTDTGSDGLSVSKAAQSKGLISGYVHATSVDACKTAIMTGPFIVGSNWYTGMDDPDSTGLVTATGTVRGGHEYLCRGYDPSTDLWDLDNSWGTGYGVLGTFRYSSPTLAKLLAESGDATQPIPITAPAPTPTPPPAPPAPPADADHVFLASATLCTRASKPYRVWKAAKGYAAHRGEHEA